MVRRLQKEKKMGFGTVRPMVIYVEKDNIRMDSTPVNSILRAVIVAAPA